MTFMKVAPPSIRMGLFFTPLDLILSSTGKLRLLRALHATRAPMSGREAASAAGIAVQPAQRALGQLVALGVVRRDDTRSQHLYTLNRESYVVQRSLGPLFEAEHARVAEVFRDLRRAVTPFETGARPRLEGMYLFGSAARGADRIGSDFDVAAITATARDVDRVHETLAEFAPEVYTRHGLRLSAVVLDLRKLRAMHAGGDALVAELLQDNRRITGKRLEQLIDGGTWKPKGRR
jgi:predicted nucleotidyltransferase